MLLKNFLLVGNLHLLCRCLGIQGVDIPCESNALRANDDTVECTLMFNTDLLAAMHILGDESLIKNMEIGLRGRPLSAAEFHGAGIEEKLNFLRTSLGECAPFDDVRRLVQLQRSQDSADCGFTSSVPAVEEGVFGVLSATYAACPEAPDKFDAGDFFQKHVRPSSEFRALRSIKSTCQIVTQEQILRRMSGSSALPSLAAPCPDPVLIVIILE
jgi:hypothetical protein